MADSVAIFVHYYKGLVAMFGQRFISEQLKTMNSTNWSAPNVWVFIAQLVEHCSANAEVMDSNPVEAPKTFFGLNCNCLNGTHNCDDHTFISFVCPQFT